MKDRSIFVENVEIVVKTYQISLHPLAYNIVAHHADGEKHEQTLTLTNTGSDVTRALTLDEAQKVLDDARNEIAKKAYTKYLTADLAKKLQ